MDKFFAYILYSPKLDKYYYGSTNNITRRLEDHNRGKTKFARLGMPWELKYFEIFDSKKEAVQRELEFKKKKDRGFIEKLLKL